MTLRAWFATLAAAALGVGGSLIAPATVANANSPITSTTVEVQYRSVLTLTQNGRTTKTAGAPARVTVERLVTPSAQPSGAIIYCNKLYTFTDPNGKYTIQHRCAGSTGPWSYTISPGVCALVVGPVSESGMTWRRNGVQQSRQAPHVVGCGYIVHGTYNPDLDYDRISYVDTYTFAVKGGHGSLSVQGNFTTVGGTCSPTSC